LPSLSAFWRNSFITFHFASATAIRTHIQMDANRIVQRPCCLTFQLDSHRRFTNSRQQLCPSVVAYHHPDRPHRKKNKAEDIKSNCAPMLESNKPVEKQLAPQRPNAEARHTPNDFSINFRNMSPGFTIIQVIHCLVTCIPGLHEHCHFTFDQSNSTFQHKSSTHSLNPNAHQQLQQNHPQRSASPTNQSSHSTPLSSSSPRQPSPIIQQGTPTSPTWDLIDTSNTLNLAFFINWFHSNSAGVHGPPQHCS
jgi:hypothetical protein